MDDLGGKPTIFGNTHIYIYIHISCCLFLPEEKQGAKTSPRVVWQTHQVALSEAALLKRFGHHPNIAPWPHASIVLNVEAMEINEVYITYMYIYSVCIYVIWNIHTVYDHAYLVQFEFWIMLRICHTWSIVDLLQALSWPHPLCPHMTFPVWWHIKVTCYENDWDAGRSVVWMALEYMERGWAHGMWALVKLLVNKHYTTWVFWPSVSLNILWWEH